eukprot:10764302-Karenia_brevis.AAC.1
MISQFTYFCVLFTLHQQRLCVSHHLPDVGARTLKKQSCVRVASRQFAPRVLPHRRLAQES